MFGMPGTAVIKSFIILVQCSWQCASGTTTVIEHVDVQENIHTAHNKIQRDLA